MVDNVPFADRRQRSSWCESTLRLAERVEGKVEIVRQQHIAGAHEVAEAVEMLSALVESKRRDSQNHEMKSVRSVWLEVGETRGRRVGRILRVQKLRDGMQHKPPFPHILSLT